MRDGVYIIKSNGKIIILKGFESYDAADGKGLFAVGTWEDESGVYKKTLLRGRQFKHFYRLGVFE